MQAGFPARWCSNTYFVVHSCGSAVLPNALPHKNMGTAHQGLEMPVGCKPPSQANRAGRGGMTKCFAIIAWVMLLALVSTDDPGFAAGKKRERLAVFEVPTTGQILDVVYHPEFDEWWVKCREGDTIAVYSYDPRSREWGRVGFAPKKPEDQSKKHDKPVAPLGLEKPQEPVHQPKAEESRVEPGREAGKADQRADKKWWDPLQILKSGEKLILPSSSERSK
jgi:hypothetical protein